MNLNVLKAISIPRAYRFAAVAIGLSVSFCLNAEAATPEAGKSPAKIADKDWKIQIVPGPSIGPSPVPAFNAAARKAAMKLMAKAQDEADAKAADDAAQNIEIPKAETAPAPPVRLTTQLPEINPNATKNAAPANPTAPVNCDQAAKSVNPSAYVEIYNSIPFSRAEYFANPSYRHEATLEILFGQLRPTTIVKATVPMTQTTHGIANPIRSHTTIRQDVRHHYSRPPYYFYPYAY